MAKHKILIDNEVVYEFYTACILSTCQRAEVGRWYANENHISERGLRVTGV